MSSTSLSTSLPSQRNFGTYSSASAIWSGAKYRFISIAPTGPGLAGIVFTIGCLFGAVVHWYLQRNTASSGNGRAYCSDISCRERYQHRFGYAPLKGSQLTQLSPQEEELRAHLKESDLILLSPEAAKLKALRDRVCVVFYSILIGAVLIAGVAWNTKNSTFHQFSLAFLSMAAGVNLGNYARKYFLSAPPKEFYDKDNDQQIKELVERFHRDVGISDLHLTTFSDHLRYFNPVKLRDEICKKFGNRKYLFLRGCRLVDDDLRRLAQAGWFSNLDSMNISDNPQITGLGLKSIGEAGGKSLTSINLSNTDLTDDDLKQMAESGYFNNLEELIICHNPRITGAGLACLIEGGFKNLKWLDMRGNPLILGKNLDKWSGKKGFEKLEAFSLGYTGLTKDEFERILEENDWIRNLRGLDVAGNPKLECPSNIAKLTNLAQYSPPYQVPKLWFDGMGLHVESRPNFRTPDFQALVKNKKVCLTD